MSEGRKYFRARFEANEEDYRPVKWPPPGPFWCSGYGEDHAMVIAYLENEDQLFEFWPEAKNEDITGPEEIVFTDRFAEPEWWSALLATVPR